MKLSSEEIAEVAGWLAVSSFGEINLAMENFTLVMRKGHRRAAPRTPPAAPPAEANPAPATAAPAAAKANEVDVPAPMLGTYYRAARPDAPPYVEVGARVTPETIIGIIEVMKLMNPVRAGVAGTVSAVFATNAAPVEAGEALIRVRQD